MYLKMGKMKQSQGRPAGTGNNVYASRGVRVQMYPSAFPNNLSDQMQSAACFLFPTNKIHILLYLMGTPCPIYQSSCWMVEFKRRFNLSFNSPPVLTNHKEIGFRHCSIREACLCQNGWIFGKFPNGFWPPPPLFRKKYCNFFRKPVAPALNLQWNFSDRKWPPPFSKLFPEIHDQNCLF